METDQQKVTRWVKEILKKQNYEKIEVEFPGYDTTGGFSSEVVFVDVNVEKNGKIEKLELILKKNKENLAALEALNITQAYKSETKVYGKLVPTLNKLAEENKCEIFQNIPQCYGTICRENEYIILLENMKSKGYKTHNLDITLDLFHIKLVLEAYARWHAFSLALNGEKSDILREFEESCKYMQGKMCGLLVKTMENELDWIIEEYKTKNKSKIIEKLQLLKKIIPDLFADSLRHENKEWVVLQHGDCWNNNFLFHYTNSKIPDKVMVIDWQVALLGTPTVDLAKFFFMNCSRKELEHLDDLLKFYHETLSKKLRELGRDPELKFPWDNFTKSFKHFAPVGIGMMPLAARMSHRVETGEKYDIAQSIEDGHFSGVSATIRDPKRCFERISGVLEYCIEHNFL